MIHPDVVLAQSLTQKLFDGEGNYGRLVTTEPVYLIRPNHSNVYSYTITHSQDATSRGNTVVLTQAATGKQKVFFIAGEPNLVGITNHMRSLTDSQCEQWFKTNEPKKKKNK